MGINGEGSRRISALVGVVAGAALLASLTVAETASTDNGCTHGVKKTVEVGIVKAIGCWTESTASGGGKVQTAAWADNPGGVDLNGFVVTGRSGGGLQIDESTRRVTSIGITSQAYELALAQLNSRNWPAEGQVNRLGDPIKLDFIAPEKSGLLLETLHLGSNSVANALAGLSPVGTVETPVRLEEEGTGSMDLTVALAGIFTLKGKPQSVTIDLPTSSGEGTKLDGFDLDLEEIDAVNFLKINNLSAKYNGATKVIAGGANLTFPFMKGKGFGANFQLDNGVLSKLNFTVHGTKIPIGGAGFLTDIAGGFSFQPVQALNFDKYCKSQGYDKAVIVGPDHGANAANHWYCQKGNNKPDGLSANRACQLQTGNEGSTARSIDTDSAYGWQCIGGITSGATSFDLEANANFGADFGTAIPSPFGEIEPVRVDAGLGIGYGGGGLVIKVNGGVTIFRLPVGDVYLILNTNAGVAFGVGLGIGFPSYKNNEDDPFYIGARVDGWIGKGHFQFEGKGRVALLSLKLFDGRVLVNDKAAGACWVVFGFNGGAVYRYGESGVRTFGVGCGLDDYKEQFPGGAAATASSPRKFALGAKRGVLAVKGDGAAPRFTLRSRDGRSYRTPTEGLSHLGADHFFYVNEFTDTTNVVLKNPRGQWTITPDEGSVPITSLKAAREVPKEKVTARIRGRGTTRTLEWDSAGRPHTRLVFTEVLPNGSEMPLLHTGKASGSKRVKVTKGTQYGKRKLRVVVVHGYASRQAKVVDKFKVWPPARLPASRKVSAWAHDHSVRVKWEKVRKARGYLVEVSTLAAGNPKASNYIRKVPAKRRSLVIRHHPAGKRTVAKVFALNADDKLGKVAKSAFATTPRARKLGDAARRSARSATLRGGKVALRVQCPRNGHCRVEVKLRRDGRVVARKRYQQTPDTLHLLRLAPKGGATGDLEAVVELRRTGKKVLARSPVG